ncbi:MAG: ABC transporter ATP-binding protein [Candidatus Heimdallarchaeota archaeon]|nr:ABC transporter ATP-binding protein [Candidatus Heimdallarchaeota archaeon]
MTSSILSSARKTQSNDRYYNKALLEIKNLIVEYPVKEGNVRAIDDVSLTLYRGEVLGLVGESGCGKSSLGFTILKLLKGGVIRSGEISFNDINLVTIPEGEMQLLRGPELSMIFQASQNALNPLQKVLNHFIDTLKTHYRWNDESWQKILELLNRLEIPESRLEDYPFQFSGGMQQRIVIALTLILNPKLIIADEPTTALDVLVQARLLEILKEIIKEYDLTVLYITHDLGIVAEITNRVAIMYAGQILEIGDTQTIFQNAAHPYTRALIEAIPNVKDEEKKLLSFIPGHPPDLRNPPLICCFADRCSYSQDICHSKKPQSINLNFENGVQHKVKCFIYDDRYGHLFDQK